jgi:hypothetical protein
MKILKTVFAIAVFFLMSYKTVNAQKLDSNYVKTIQARAAKIVQKLALSDDKKIAQLNGFVAMQYIHLNEVYTARDARQKSIKQNTTLSKDEAAKEIEKTNQLTAKKTKKLHNNFLNKLEKQLNNEQVIAIKDGMTYGVVPLTYNAYLQMLPNITEEQKKQIYAWLIEARELAMDAESSEKKHAWFGKYKGRINNYLSAAGIDMKQAGIDWAKRIKEEKAN